MEIIPTDKTALFSSQNYSFYKSKASQSFTTISHSVNRWSVPVTCTNFYRDFQKVCRYVRPLVYRVSWDSRTLLAFPGNQRFVDALNKRQTFSIYFLLVHHGPSFGGTETIAINKYRKAHSSDSMPKIPLHNLCIQRRLSYLDFVSG